MKISWALREQKSRKDDAGTGARVMRSTRVREFHARRAKSRREGTDRGLEIGVQEYRVSRASWCKRGGRRGGGGPSPSLSVRSSTRDATRVAPSCTRTLFFTTASRFHLVFDVRLNFCGQIKVRLALVHRPSTSPFCYLLRLAFSRKFVLRALNVHEGGPRRGANGFPWCRPSLQLWVID